MQKIQHRHIWDVPEKDDDSVDHDNDEDDDDYVDENKIFMRLILNEDDEVNIELSRDDVDSESFDANDKEVRRMLGLKMRTRKRRKRMRRRKRRRRRRRMMMRKRRWRKGLQLVTQIVIDDYGELCTL